jgi:hypothetical protein
MAARDMRATTSRIDGEWLYRTSPISSAGQTAGSRGTRENVGDAGEHGLGGQIGPLVVNDGKEQHAGPMRAELARDLQRRGTTGQVEQHRHVALLQLVERITDAIGPNDGHVRAGEELLRFRAFSGRAANIEDGFHRPDLRGPAAATK